MAVGILLVLLGVMLLMRTIRGGLAGKLVGSL